MAFARLKALWGGKPGEGAQQLYAALVALARNPDWYRDAGVPDTLDGRFEMVALMCSLATRRLDALGETARDAGVQLTEAFVNDMEAQLREIGYGDVVVSKHMGKMMSAFGGRIGSLAKIDEDDAMAAFIARTLHAEADPAASPAQAARALMLLRAMNARLGATGLDDLLKGRIAA